MAQGYNVVKLFTFYMLHFRVGSWLYPQTLDWGEDLERLARDKDSSLLQTFVNYGRKKICNIGPSTQSYKYFLAQNIPIFTMVYPSKNRVKIAAVI